MCCKPLGSRYEPPPPPPPAAAGPVAFARSRFWFRSAVVLARFFFLVPWGGASAAADPPLALVAPVVPMVDCAPAITFAAMLRPSANNTCAVPSAALAVGPAAVARTAVCAAGGPSSLAIPAGMLMLALLPRPRPAATALVRIVALVSPAAVPPSTAPPAIAATGPLDIHAGRLTSPPRPRPPGGRMGVKFSGIRGGTPPLLGIRAEELLLL